MPRTCVVRLLGGFTVEVDGRPIPSEAWRHRRGADLVKLLALTSRHQLHREQVMEALWPGMAADAAAGNLRKALHFARRGLGGKEGIDGQGDMLLLWPHGELFVDTERVEAEARKALVTGLRLEAVAELFTGELLPNDRYAEWSEQPRERLRDLRLQLLRAAGLWDQVLELDSTDEEACRALMRAHLETGNRQAAIRQFQRLRATLRVDLGVAPDPSTVALFEEAVTGEGPQPPTTGERVQVLLARGLVHWNQRQFDDARRLAEDARRLAIEHHLGRELGEASALLGMVALARGHWQDLFRREFAAAIRLGVDEAPFVLEAHVCLAEASLAAADSESIARLARELLPLALEAGSTPGEALTSLLIGESSLFSGQLDESREWLSRAVDLYAEVGGDSGRAFALVRVAEVFTALGQRVEATRELTEARRLADRSELSSHLLVRVFAGMVQAADDRASVRRLLLEAEGTLRWKEVCGPCSIGFRVAAAIACARSADVGRSRRWLADAERLAGMWQGGPWQAAVWEARAELRLATRDRVQAAGLFREAADLFAECGRPLDGARCLAAAADLATVDPQA